MGGRGLYLIMKRVNGRYFKPIEKMGYMKDFYNLSTQNIEMLTSTHAYFNFERGKENTEFPVHGINTMH